MSDLYDWCGEYLDALPPGIRASTDDSRFISAARRARDNGWTSAHAARVVAGTNYSRAINPPYIALVTLERIGERAPYMRPAALNPSGCIVCPPGVRCPDPVTERTPPRWVAERMALIRELTGRRDYTEDEREEAMRILIDHQRQEATT